MDNGQTAQATYNALGWRVYNVFPSGNVAYLHDAAGQSIGGNWGFGGNQFVFFGNRILGDYEADGLHFVHANALDSSTQSGTQEVLYYPWGQVWKSTPGASVHFVFAGLPDGDPPDFSQTVTRRYSQTKARWMTPDMLGGDITNPQSLNRYAYALNNPTTLTDPSGLGPDGFDGGDCSDPSFADSHSECQGPGSPYCLASDDPYDCGGGFPVGGGGGGAGTGGGARPGGSTTISTGPSVEGATDPFNSFVHNPLPCLTPEQQSQLADFLLNEAAAPLLRTGPLNSAGTSVQGGALNVKIAIPRGGLPVSPDVIANADPSNPIFEHGYPLEIRADAVVPVGPGTSVHVVFQPGTNPQGQPVILQAKVHADIGNASLGGSGLGKHIWWDGALATIFSAAQGCPVKFD